MDTMKQPYESPVTDVMEMKTEYRVLTASGGIQAARNGYGAAQTLDWN